MPPVVQNHLIFDPLIMKLNHANKTSGQALIEYLLIFSFMTFISIGLVKGVGKTLLSSVGSLGYELTEQLTIGVCKKFCYYEKYENGAQ